MYVGCSDMNNRTQSYWQTTDILANNNRQISPNVILVTLSPCMGIACCQSRKTACGRHGMSYCGYLWMEEILHQLVTIGTMKHCKQWDYSGIDHLPTGAGCDWWRFIDWYRTSTLPTAFHRFRARFPWRGSARYLTRTLGLSWDLACFFVFES